MKIGLFYGSNTGNTEAVAYQIQTEFHKHLPDTVEVHNIGASNLEQILRYTYLVFGIPTWNVGQLQDDWEEFLPNFKSMDMKGKKVAIFGLGDQNGYGFNFLDAVGMLADEVLLAGADVYGLWTTQGYEFEESRAQIEEYFLGLGLDHEAQEDLSPKRITKWVQDVKVEFEL